MPLTDISISGIIRFLLKKTLGVLIQSLPVFYQTDPKVSFEVIVPSLEEISGKNGLKLIIVHIALFSDIFILKRDPANLYGFLRKQNNFSQSHD